MSFRVVSYLPSVGLLLPHAGHPESGSEAEDPSQNEVAVFGVGFGPAYPWGLPRLRESLDEASAIATVHHVQPRVGSRRDSRVSATRI